MRLLKFFCVMVLFASGLISGGASAAPEKFQIDSQHTHIVWQVDRFGFAKTIGSFADVTGVIMLDEIAPENSSVQAEITLAGLRSDLLEREDIVRGVFWLNAANFPTITFVSNRVVVREGNGQKHADIEGTMTLKGASGPLILRTNLNRIGIDPVTKKKAVGFTATGIFKRSDFGVKTAVGPVGDDVTFQIEIMAVSVE